MNILHDIKSIRAFQTELKNKAITKTIGFVPTMGALHPGHLSLVKLAKQKCDVVIVSIFVNQKQFNNAQDFEKYPNTIEQDISMLEAAGVDVLFNPFASEIYSADFKTSVIISDLTDELCGKTRPGHFDGVALVVSKLFNIIKPDFAFFGEKDFQQLQIIRRLVQDLNFDLQIVAGETLRESDGLAMSSRNLRLSQNARSIAPEIYKNLTKAKEKVLQNSGKNIELILQEVSQNLLKSGFDKIDYAEVCDVDNLKPIKVFDAKIKVRLFVAAFIEGVRLIDNIPLN